MSFETISAKLHNYQQAHKFVCELLAKIKPLMVAGHQFGIELFDAKTREQERLYHSCFRDLARDCLFGGAKQDEEAWKRALLHAFYEGTKNDPEFVADWRRRAPRVIPTLDGTGLLLIGIESKKFTKALARAFITFVHSVGDERGVHWSVTSLGREWAMESA
jgi:hypothetical protein